MRRSRPVSREQVAAFAEKLSVEVTPTPPAENADAEARPEKDPLEALARLLASAWLRSKRRGNVRPAKEGP